MGVSDDLDVFVYRREGITVDIGGFMIAQCRRTTFLVVMVCVNVIVYSGMLNATVINVPGDYSKVQDAINAASPGDTVSVASGRYAPSTNEEAFPISMKDGVRLLGAGASVCSLDAESTDRVVYCYNMSNADNIIAGFTITNGDNITRGGGIYCNYYTTMTIIDNTITSNSSDDRGGGIMLNNNCSGEISNNIITGNSTGWFGAGIGCDTDCSPSIVNNVITGNTSVSGGGGGISCHYSSNPNITNNVINGNTASQDGSGITLYFTSAPVITNTIVSNNSGGSAGIFAYQSSPSINYCDVWNNSTANYSGCSAGTGCISADPLFMNAGTGDYHLQTSSPCIDTGDNYAPDIPAYDFDGYSRIIDGNNDGNAVVDLGPFEHPEIVGKQEDERYAVSAFSIVKNPPNPFYDQTTIDYCLSQGIELNIIIYNVLGKRTVGLFSGFQEAGSYNIAWNGMDKIGRRCPSGVYYCEFKFENRLVIVKMLLMR